MTGVESATHTPPWIVFTDSSWGGGDHRMAFSLVVNPVTGEAELWQMNEDGTLPSKLAVESWFKTEWSVMDCLPNYGGL